MSFKTILATLTAPDKVLHGKGSIGVLLLSIAILFVGYQVGLHPVSIMLLEGGLLAAISVEGTQWFDNKNAKARGEAPPHEVSALDAFFSTLAPLVAVIAIEVARFLGVLPTVFNALQSNKLPPWLT